VRHGSPQRGRHCSLTGGVLGGRKPPDERRKKNSGIGRD
jgi:hypothetical protein